MITDVLIILFLLILNGLFSMSEIALVSSRKSRLQKHASEGSKGAKIALKLSKEPEKFLSTVQIGITLVGIVAGAYGGENFTKALLPIFERAEFLEPYTEEVTFAIVLVGITYFTLIIGELVPKSIALNNPEKITIIFSQFMRVLSIITYPFVAFLSFSTKLFLKLFGLKENSEPPVTEEELKYLLDVGSQHGIIEKRENEIVHEVFRFAELKAKSIMTLRGDISWIDINKNKEEIIAEIKETTFTKFLVCDKKIDDVVGIVSVKDVLFLDEKDEKFDLSSIIKEAIFIPETSPALKILDLFRKKKLYMGVVVNEHGEVEGLITLTNLIENIVGDLPVAESEEPQIILREDDSWLCDADVKIDDLKEVVGISKFPGESTYTSLSGFILYHLKKIPVSGEKFSYSDFTFEIVDMDGPRIDKVLIRKE